MIQCTNVLLEHKQNFLKMETFRKYHYSLCHSDRGIFIIAHDHRSLTQKKMRKSVTERDRKHEVRLHLPAKIVA